MSDVSELEVGEYILKRWYHRNICLVRVGGTDDNGNDIDRWAIKDGENMCLSKTGKWEREPMPSSRSDRYIKTHRWLDPNEAYRFWLKCEAKA